MANIVIASTVIPDWHYAGTAFTLRIFSDRSWMALDNTDVPGRGNSDAFYREYPISVIGTNATIPQVTLASQTDAPNDRSALYMAYFYADGVQMDMFLESSLRAFQVPDEPAGTTWKGLEQYAVTNWNRRWRNDLGTYSALVIDQKIAAVTGTTNLATSTLAGLPTASTAGRQRLVTDVDESLYLDNGTQWWSLTHGVFDFKRFGGIGDGATSNTTILNAIITAIGSNQGTIVFPYSASPYVVGSVSVPANVTLDFTSGGAVYVTTGQTLTHAGPILATPRKIFYNATAGLGTVSFTGNKVITDFQTAWWGPDGTGVTDSLARLQACEAACVTAGGGNIIIGHAQYSIAGTWIVNSAGTIRAVNVIGVSATPTGGSIINYTGATNLPAVKFNIDKFAKFTQVRVQNSVAAGTTAGVLFTGPSTGEQTANINPDNVLITGFHVGMDLGDGTAATAQITLNTCYLDGNDIGLRAQNFNSVNINSYNSSFLNNAQYGIQATIYNLNVFGGSFANNTLGDFNLTPNMGTYLLDGIRTELNTAGSFVVGGNIINLTVQNLLVQSLTVSSAPLILADGVITLKGSTIHPGAPSTAMTIYQSQGNAALGQFICEGNEINSGATMFDPAFGNNGNLHYRIKNNQKWADGAATSGRFVDEEGVVVGVTKMSFTEIGSGFASTPSSPAQITSSQNNYVLPNALYIRLNTDASRNITGVVTSPTQIDGQTHRLINSGAQDIVIINQSASSTAANRFLNVTGADITLTANQQAEIIYDLTTARWRCNKIS